MFYRTVRQFVSYTLKYNLKNEKYVILLLNMHMVKYFSKNMKLFILYKIERYDTYKDIESGRMF